MIILWRAPFSPSLRISLGAPEEPRVLTVGSGFKFVRKVTKYEETAVEQKGTIRSKF